MKRKALPWVGVLALLAVVPMVASAHTSIFLGLNLGGLFGPPVVYAAPPPVYVAPPPPVVYAPAPYPYYYRPRGYYRGPGAYYGGTIYLGHTYGRGHYAHRYSRHPHDRYGRGHHYRSHR